MTLILPRGKPTTDFNPVAAGTFAFNGWGEMTGIWPLSEQGLLYSPIALTGTVSVGAVHEALCIREYGQWLPVVGETYDGHLNDSSVYHVRPHHVRAALEDASGGPVQEGNVGAGTGIICHGFKSGIGTSSRRVTVAGNEYTVAVLVQSNHGRRHHLRVDGLPVGRWIDETHTPLSAREVAKAQQATITDSSSIIMVIATDAPLLPLACQRLAKRSTAGLVRVGSTGYDGSGDIFIAFSTGNDFRTSDQQPHQLQAIPHLLMNPLFDATADATEEAILNSICMCETMYGREGAVAHAIPLDTLKELWEQHRGSKS